MSCAFSWAVGHESGAEQGDRLVAQGVGPAESGRRGGQDGRLVGRAHRPNPHVAPARRQQLAVQRGEQGASRDRRASNEQ